VLGVAMLEWLSSEVNWGHPTSSMQYSNSNSVLEVFGPASVLVFGRFHLLSELYITALD
jgi:hypothetical protein